MASYSFAQIEDLWRQAGGNALAAPMAAAVAMAESGGDPNSTNHNSNGTVDRGIWQINSIHGSLSTFDPMANARAAVQISANGTTWRPWCTAWSNGDCSGTYLGTGSPYSKYLPSGSPTGAEAGGQVTDTPAIFGLPIPGIPNLPTPNLNPLTYLNAIGVWLWYGSMSFLGGLLIVVGIGLLIKETTAAQTVRAAAVGALSRGTVRTDIKQRRGDLDDTGVTRTPQQAPPPQARRRTPRESPEATRQRRTDAYLARRRRIRSDEQ